MISDCLSVNEKGHLAISGCDTIELAEKYSTPLYVMSEDKIRAVCRSYIKSFEKFYNGFGKPVYASKAFSCKEIYRIISSEGLDSEVVSGGELYTALEAGVSPARIHFQGNNKTNGELRMAVENRVGNIVADNLSEIKKLQEISREQGVVSKITIRVKPGIDAHTHEFIRTGQEDSKFGVSLASGEAFEAVRLAAAQENLELMGLHCHIGSQILETKPFVAAVETMLDFFRRIEDELGVKLRTLNLGGGFGIKYTEDDDTLSYESYMEQVSSAVHRKCTDLGLSVPEIFIEPGRSVVGEAGITLYTVGNIKEIPGIRNYVAIDGGMFDNPRYALYDAKYTCLVANRAGEPKDYRAAIAGKCCESGDLIQSDALIQKPQEGDIIAVLSTGAYNYSMSSNYNRNLRPACVMVAEGKPRIIIKAETYEDIVRNDV